MDRTYRLATQRGQRWRRVLWSWGVAVLVSVGPAVSAAQPVPAGTPLGVERFANPETRAPIAWAAIMVPALLLWLAEDRGQLAVDEDPWLADLVRSGAGPSKTRLGWLVQGEVSGTPNALTVSARLSKDSVVMRQARWTGDGNALLQGVDSLAAELGLAPRLAVEPLPVDRYALDLVSRALVAHADGKAAAVQRNLERALLIAPEIVPAVRLLGVATQDRNQPRAVQLALGKFALARELAPTSLANLRAWVAADPDDVAAWRTWVAAQPWSPTARRGLAFALLAAARDADNSPALRNEALGALTSVAAAGFDVKVSRAIIELHVEMAAWSAADAAALAYLQQVPADFAVIDLRSTVLVQLGQPIAAAQWLAQSVAQRPNDEELFARIGELLRPNAVASEWLRRSAMAGSRRGAYMLWADAIGAPGANVPAQLPPIAAAPGWQPWRRLAEAWRLEQQGQRTVATRYREAALATLEVRAWQDADRTSAPVVWPAFTEAQLLASLTQMQRALAHVRDEQAHLMGALGRLTTTCRTGNEADGTNVGSLVPAWTHAVEAALTEAARLVWLARHDWSRWLLPQTQRELATVLASAQQLPAARALALRTMSTRMVAPQRPATAARGMPAVATRANLIRITVDNGSCAEPMWLTMAARSPVQVAARSTLALSVPQGGTAFCLLPAGASRCGDAGTLRTAYIIDGWSIRTYCQ